MKKLNLTILLLVCGFFGFSQSESGLSKVRLSKIDNYFETLVEEGKVAGVITLAARNNKIEHHKTYGYSDIEKGQEIRKDALIPIGSMTKIITSIAVLQLYEAGKFSLNDPIKKYIPELKKLSVIIEPKQSKTDSIQTKKVTKEPTIRDFLRHTAGMTYSYRGTIVDKLYVEAGFRKWDKSLQEYVKTLGEIPLVYQPGEKWQYSYSHDVLGYLVEKVSGKPLDQYFQEHIFAPLEMNTAGFKAIEKLRFTNLYKYQNGKLVVRENNKDSRYLEAPPVFSGGGGWSDSYCGVVCSVEDFYKLSKMLLNYGKYNDRQILGRKTIELMTANNIGNLRGDGEGYGLGIGVITSVGDYGQVASEGEVYWAGAPYNTYFWIDYKEQTIGIMFTNTSPFGLSGMMDKYKVFVTQAIE